MKIYKEALEDLRDAYFTCSELFDIAFMLNNDENTRTAFSKKVTTYMPDVMQIISYFIGEIDSQKDDDVILIKEKENEIENLKDERNG